MIAAKTRDLTGIAASVIAKCQPCLEYHLAEARKAGVSDADVKTAVKIAQAVRQAGNEKMDEFTASTIGNSSKQDTSCCCSDEKCCG